MLCIQDLRWDKRCPSPTEDTETSSTSTASSFSVPMLFARLTAWVTPTGLWGKIGRKFVPSTVHPVGHKLNPWWQDIMVLFIAVGTVVLAAVIYAGTPSTPLGFLACYLLFDMVAYHAGVLWFDDLQPGRPWPQLRVLSHRRLFFQAFINFAESIVLFGVLYESQLCMREPPPAVYEASFRVATTLSPPDTIRGCAVLTSSQVGVSLFFLAVVISIVASVAYSRRELSPTDNN